MAVCNSCLRTLRLQAQRASRELFVSPHLISSKALPQSRIPTNRISPLRLPTASTHTRNYASAATTTNTAAPGPSSQTQSAPTFDARTTKPKEAEHETAQETTETLFKECARQADYIIPQAFEATGAIPKNALGEDMGQGSGWWYDTLALPPTFNTWAQVTFLHMYLLTVRLRYLEPERCAMWLQHLQDHFFFEAEHRMVIFHKISSKAIRQRYLKEMYNQWRGALGAYDEGLIKGDAVLGTAVWRNVFRGGQGTGAVGGAQPADKGTTGNPGAGQLGERELSGEAVTAREKVEGNTSRMEGQGKKQAEITQQQQEASFDWRHVACVVAFMRRGLSRLDKASDSIIMAGKVRFGSPAAEWENVVGAQSKGVKAGFEPVDDEALKKWNSGQVDAE